MHQYLTYSEYRREEWLGFDSPEAVRRSLLFARRNRREIKVFYAGTDNGVDAYREILPEDWFFHFGLRG